MVGVSPPGSSQAATRSMRLIASLLATFSKGKPLSLLAHERTEGFNGIGNEVPECLVIVLGYPRIKNRQNEDIPTAERAWIRGILLTYLDD